MFTHYVSLGMCAHVLSCVCVCVCVCGWLTRWLAVHTPFSSYHAHASSSARQVSHGSSFHGSLQLKDHACVCACVWVCVCVCMFVCVCVCERVRDRRRV